MQIAPSLTSACVLTLLDEHEFVYMIMQLRSSLQLSDSSFLLSNVACSIVSFTSMSSEMDPMDVVDVLTTVFSQFDALSATHGVYKLDIVGGAWVTPCSMPWLLMQSHVLHLRSAGVSTMLITAQQISCKPGLQRFSSSRLRHHEPS